MDFELQTSNMKTCPHSLATCNSEQSQAHSGPSCGPNRTAAHPPSLHPKTGVFFVIATPQMIVGLSPHKHLYVFSAPHHSWGIISCHWLSIICPVSHFLLTSCCGSPSNSMSTKLGQKQSKATKHYWKSTEIYGTNMK